MKCISCPAAFTENWPREQSVLRCGADGERKGHVTEIFPTGHIGVISQRESPAWCPLRDRVTEDI